MLHLQLANWLGYARSLCSARADVRRKWVAHFLRMAWKSTQLSKAMTYPISPNRTGPSKVRTLTTAKEEQVKGHMQDGLARLGERFPDKFGQPEVKAHLNRCSHVLDSIPAFWHEAPKEARARLKKYACGLDNDLKLALREVNVQSAGIAGELSSKEKDLLTIVSVINMLNHLVEKSDKHGKKFFQQFEPIRSNITSRAIDRVQGTKDVKTSKTRSTSTTSSATSRTGTTTPTDSGRSSSKRLPSMSRQEQIALTTDSTSEDLT
jgi:hypothetical protein